MTTTPDLPAAPVVPATPVVRRPGGGGATRAATICAVLAVAAIAAVVSYRHMRAVALGHGEDPVNATIIPLSVDGLIIAASMSMLHASQAGRRPATLAYALLVTASAASLAANVIHAEPGLVARVIAAWPSFALIGAYELLMRMIRAGGAARACQPAGTTATAPTPIPDHTGDRAAPEPTPGEPAREEPTRDGPVRGDPAPGGTAGGEPAPGGPPGDPWVPPVPPAAPLPGVARRRPDTKRARLCTLLSTVSPDDPRSTYALAKAFAPVVGLHEGTARRYIAEERLAS